MAEVNDEHDHSSVSFTVRHNLRLSSYVLLVNNRSSVQISDELNTRRLLFDFARVYSFTILLFVFFIIRRRLVKITLSKFL